ncbi:allantoicase [Pseudonocardia humida]|uniref:Probable allantoicase n=1 Tax=Pseudonocardia humida TaxID=2800819 RepID=A0ABT0ZS76_9PSEU|nr:allantoicase [Pseudonocardia humida]MCO1653569.1 allantoicase [Pseudonocardia humida]
MGDFRQLPDLALRTLGGSVVHANDESFAARENLITPGPAVFDPTEFGHRGKVYDGWETRRRREPGHDEAIVRLGAAGIVRGVVVDTAFFTGNYPPEVSVQGLYAGDDVDPATARGWEELVPRSGVAGDSENSFAVESGSLLTHVRLRIHPDGGVARLRVHGEAVPDVRVLDALGTVDVAALENGGMVTDCSNLFYSSPQNLLVPGPARSMGEGWETARRRDDGNDWVEVRLGAECTLAAVVLDTSYFLHNAPGAAVLSGRVGGGPWRELLARTPLRPDTRHRYLLAGTGAGTTPVDAVRLDIHPDGGMARLRVFGTPTPAGREAAGLRWFTALPPAAAASVLVGAGVEAEAAAALAAGRPLTADALPAAARAMVTGRG